MCGYKGWYKNCTGISVLNAFRIMGREGVRPGSQKVLFSCRVIIGHFCFVGRNIHDRIMENREKIEFRFARC